MTHRQSLLIAALMLGATALPRRGNAQDAAQAEPAFTREEPQQFYRYVLIEDANDLDQTLFDLIDDSVISRLKSEPFAQSSKWGITGLQLARRAVTRDDFATAGLESGSFTVWYQGQPSPQELEATWETARGNMEQALRTIQVKSNAKKQQDRERRLVRLEERRAVLQREMQSLVDILEDRSRNADQSPVETRKELSATLAQLRQLQLEQIGVQARRAAIEQRIDQLRKIGEAEAAEDPVIDELRKVLDLREQQLARLRALGNAGAVAASELQTAEAERAVARIELLKEQRDAADRASGFVLQELNNELSTLMINAAELDEKLKAISDFVAQLREQSATRVWAEIDTLTEKLQRTRTMLVDADASLMELQNEHAPDPKPISIRPLDEAIFGTDGEQSEVPAPQP